MPQTEFIERESLNFILQFATQDSLQKIEAKIRQHYNLQVLQNPVQQTLMIPVKDPISGGEFYAGEVLVTTSLVALINKDNPSIKAQGWAMVMDDSPKLSLLIAIIDAYYGLGLKDSITSDICNLVIETKNTQTQQQTQNNHNVDKTRVVFELM